MNDRCTILTVKQNPSGPLEQGEATAHMWKMDKDGDGYKVVISQSCETNRRRKSVAIDSRKAEKWLKRLQAISISLMPEVPETCDGSHYTFSFQGYLVGIELNWHNTPPAGADQLGEFTEWLWSLVPEEWDIPKDEMGLLDLLPPQLI
jgi:hypothetical protein